MPITQTIENIGDAPVEGSSTFRQDASTIWGKLKTAIDHINIFGTQATELEKNVNTKAVQVSEDVETVIEAKTQTLAARDEAVGAVSSLPDGVINDATITETDTWSSSKIENKISQNIALLHAYTL